jgi:hypothetical protein
VKDLSIPLRLCAFARKKKNKSRKAPKPQRRDVFPFAISLNAVGGREISERPFYSFAPLRLCEKKKYNSRKVGKPQRAYRGQDLRETASFL